MVFPADQLLDLHDLVGMVLYEFGRSEPRFKHSQLVEINRGVGDLVSVPHHLVEPFWSEAEPDQSKVAYVLSSDGSATETTTPATFVLDKEELRDQTPVPLASIKPFELETIFWRCKMHDNGFLVCNILQQVLDGLPKSTRLRIRTSKGHQITCAASEFMIIEFDIMPKELVCITKTTPQPDIGPSHAKVERFITGHGGPYHWVYLLCGKATSPNLVDDTRVVVDLAATQIGMRGGGGEIFGMERGQEYHHEILSRAAHELSVDMKSSGRIKAPSGEKGKAVANTTKAILKRLEDPASRNKYCTYCGAPDAARRCPKCHVLYCDSPCQKRGWKYHKVWCA